MAEAEEQIIQRLLTAIENDAGVSQRRLSQDMGIAVGSVNWHLKRCLKKGLIKLRQAPVKRYLYYLTPKGFEEKSRLTASFLQRSFELYRVGRRECHEFFQTCDADQKTQVFLVGDGDLAEIACLSAVGTGVRVKAVVDDAATRAACAGVPVFRELKSAIAGTGGALPDAVLLTEIARPRRRHAAILEEGRSVGLPESAVHVLPLLGFSP